MSYSFVNRPAVRFDIIDATDYLLSIYNKGEKDSISDKEIEELLESFL